MSRSRKRTPISGMTTKESEKKDKQIWHKRLRRKARQLLNMGVEELPGVKDVSDPWKMDKDGKQYHPDWNEGLRK